MSILGKGTLTVVVATVIASGMIAFTGNSIAEDKERATIENIVSSNQVDGMPKKITTIEKQTDEMVSKNAIPVVNNIALAPPPGPFLNKDGVSVAQKSLLAPIAPKAPISLSKQPERRANSLHFKTAPSLSQKVSEPKADLNKPKAPKLSKSAPQIDQKIGSASSSPGEAPKQAMMPKSKSIAAPALVAPKSMTKEPEMKSADIPIWSQRGDVNGQGSSPSSKSTLQQNQAVMGMPNMGWNNNYPTQQYIYVPVPMMPSNITPPQMPVFNGNIIPPSNYWGAPRPSNNVPITPMQKGNK